MLATLCSALAFAPPSQLLSRSVLTNAAAAATAILPAAAAHAEGESINGAFKQAFSDALGPYAESAPIAGTALFLIIYAIDIGAFGGGSTEEPPAPPAGDAPPPAESE